MKEYAVKVNQKIWEDKMVKLKSAIIIMVIIATATMASAQQIYTVEDGLHEAALSITRLEKALKYRASEDMKAYEKYYMDDYFIFLHEGEKIYIERTYKNFIQVRPVGTYHTVWTTKKAVGLE